MKKPCALEMPAITIITALHNKGAYVAQTVRSVLAQTMPDWELIVVENGSNDNGPDVVRQFSDSRIRLVVSPKCGPGAARNFGLGLAAGEWILFLDADDLIQPAYLQEQLKVASEHSAADVVAGCWQEFSDNPRTRFDVKRPSAYLMDSEQVLTSAIAYAPWALHAAMVHRDCLGDTRRWFEHLDCWPSEDTAFWFAAIQGATIAWSRSIGALYRVHTSNSRNSPKDANRWFEGLKRATESNLKTLALAGKSPSTAQRATMMRTFESRYRKAARDKDDECAARFLAEAKQWLRTCSWDDPSIALRKVFGIPLVARFRRMPVGLPFSPRDP